MPELGSIGGSINAEGSLIGFSITLAAVSFEVFSAHCSSPWTSESFGGNPEKAASARRYVARSIVVTEVIGLGGMLLARSWLPFAATSAVCAYMYWTYEVALNKAAKSGSQNWGS